VNGHLEAFSFSTYLVQFGLFLALAFFFISFWFYGLATGFFTLFLVWDGLTISRMVL